MAKRNLKKEEVLPFALAHELLSYEPATGLLSWRRPPRRGVAAGPAGCRNADGYLIVGYGGQEYLGTHLIWLLMTGQWPMHGVDHKNRTSHDDRWENLRAATFTQNNHNMSLRKDNPTGVRGVSIDPKRGDKKFYSRIRVGGEAVWLGYFARLEDAAQARQVAELKYFGEYSPLYGG